MMKVQLALFILLLAAEIACQEQDDAFQEGSNYIEASSTLRVLSLFSGTKKELGLDPRLGRQVLKLAQQRARQLFYPKLQDVQLTVYSDEGDCDTLNSLPARVASHFYLASDEWPCSNKNSSDNEESKKQEYCSSLQQERRQLEEILANSHDYNSSKVRTKKSLAEGSNVDAILGPSCDYLLDLIARMAAYWRTPIYSVASINARFGQKDIYSTLTRLSPSIDHITMFILRTLAQFQWRHLAILADTLRPETGIVLENLEQTISRWRQTQYLTIEHTLFTLIHSNLELQKGRLCSPELRDALVGARKVARVLLLLVDPQRVRNLLLCAYELKLNNGEFTFLALNLDLKSSDSNSFQEINSAKLVLGQNTQQQSSRQHQLDWYSAKDESNNLIARQMFESLMVYSVELPISDEYNLFVEQLMELMAQESAGGDANGNQFERSSVGALAVALHDSLLLACQAHLRRLELQNERREKGFIKQNLGLKPLAWGENFAGGLLSAIHINENGDQELDYVLSDLEPELGVMRPVARYSKEDRQYKALSSAYIHWPVRLNGATQQLLNNDQPPPDEPECGFQGDAERCLDRQSFHAALATVAVLALLIAVSASLALYKCHQIRYQMKLDDYWWRVEWHELQFIQVSGGDSLVSSCPESVARAIQSGNASIIEGNSEVGSFEGSSVISVHLNKTTTKTSGLGPVKGSPSRRPPSAAPTLQTSETDGNSKIQTKQSLGLGGSEVDICQTRSALSSVVRSSRMAMCRRELVIVKQLNASSIEMSRELLIDLKSMRDHIHDNLAKFVGLCVDVERVSIIYEFCSRGSLQDLLLTPSIDMDWTLRYSIIGDLVRGLQFIHSTQLDYHGRLKSSNLVLDSRFTLKITDFGLQNLYNQLDPMQTDANSSDSDSDSSDEDNDDNNTEAEAPQRIPRDLLSLSVSQRGATKTIEGSTKRGHSNKTGSSHSCSSQQQQGARTRVRLGKELKNRASARYFWTAPEHLRDKNVHFVGSKRGDIYSLGIILFELFTRREPYYYGTTARPHWPNIKADRRHQQQRPVLQHHGALARRTRGSEVSLTNSTASLSQQKQRSLGGGGKVSSSKRTAQVAPDLAETQSVASGRSLASSVASGFGLTHPSKQRAPPEASFEELAELEDEFPEEDQLVVSSIQSNKERIDAEEVLDQIRMGIQPDPVRPYVPSYLLQEVSPKLIELMRNCWQEQPALRPNVPQVRNQLRRITKGVASKNYLDNLLDRLQTYANQLERIVDAKTVDIVEEKFRTEELLYQLVPKFVADRLKRNEPIVPRLFDGVTIFFSDIVGFEKYASVLLPGELVDLLNSIYASFDSIISSFDVTKIETIIDQFLVASGISLQQSNDNINPTQQDLDQVQQQQQQQDNNPGNKANSWTRAIKRGPSKQTSLDQAQAPPHAVAQPQPPVVDLANYQRASAEQIARMAICVRDLVKSTHFRQQLARTAGGGGEQMDSGHKEVNNKVNLIASSFNIRIGIHSGKVCAGIVGANRPKFCLIGDTVNVASRMHTNSKANKIQISSTTKQLLEQVPGFNIEPRGQIEVKGKGCMETFWLEASY